MCKLKDLVDEIQRSVAAQLPALDPPVPRSTNHLHQPPWHHPTSQAVTCCSSCCTAAVPTSLHTHAMQLNHQGKPSALQWPCFQEGKHRTPHAQVTQAGNGHRELDKFPAMTSCPSSSFLPRTVRWLRVPRWAARRTPDYQKQSRKLFGTGVGLKYFKFPSIIRRCKHLPMFASPVSSRFLTTSRLSLSSPAQSVSPGHTRLSVCPNIHHTCNTAQQILENRPRVVRLGVLIWLGALQCIPPRGVVGAAKPVAAIGAKT